MLVKNEWVRIENAPEFGPGKITEEDDVDWKVVFPDLAGSDRTKRFRKGMARLVKLPGAEVRSLELRLSASTPKAKIKRGRAQVFAFPMK